MADEPENLVLAQLRDIRRELGAALDHVATSMKATHRVYERLEQFQDALDRLSGDIAAHRQENRKSFMKIESDIVSLETQNISRHGEVLNPMRVIPDWKTFATDEIAANTNFDPATGTLTIAGKTLSIGGKPVRFVVFE